MGLMTRKKPVAAAPVQDDEAAARSALVEAQRQADAARIAKARTEAALTRVADLVEAAERDVENAEAALAEAETAAQRELMAALKAGEEVPDAPAAAKARVRLADAQAALARAQGAKVALAAELRTTDPEAAQRALSSAAKGVLAVQATALLAEAMRKWADLQRDVAALLWCRNELSVEDHEPGKVGNAIRDTILRNGIESFLNFLSIEARYTLERPEFEPVIAPWRQSLAALRQDATAALPEV